MKQLTGAISGISTAVSQEASPLLIRFAKPIPKVGSWVSSAQKLAPLVMRGQGWEPVGAHYDVGQGVWIRKGSALVEDPRFMLGTKTMTEGREDIDEDE